MEIEEKNPVPFFIVGVQRSGTTLLRLILNAHSKIAIPEEASFLKPLLSTKWIKKSIKGNEKDKVVSYLRNNEQFKLWNFDREPLLNEIESRDIITIKEIMEIMYSSYAKHEGKSNWGDKSLFFGSMENINKMFPEALFIHIVRDGRDVFHSWRKMDPSKSHPSVMALDWKAKHYLIEKSLKEIPKQKIHLIRYEDLVNDPKKQLLAICDFLNIPFEDKMISFHKDSNKYIGKHHSDLIFKAIDKSNTNKWKKTLTLNEQSIYQLVVKKSLKKYDYELIDDKAIVKTYFLTFFDLTIGLPKRFIELLKVRFSFWIALRKGEAPKNIKVGDMPEINN